MYFIESLIINIQKSLNALDTILTFKTPVSRNVEMAYYPVRSHAFRVIRSITLIITRGTTILPRRFTQSTQSSRSLEVVLMERSISPRIEKRRSSTSDLPILVIDVQSSGLTMFSAREPMPSELFAKLPFFANANTRTLPN